MYEVQVPLSLIFTLFFMHFLSLLYWQCMLLHVIFGILHHSFLIICVLDSYMCTRQSAVSSSPTNIVIYNMLNSLSKKTQMPLHAAAAFKQRKEFFRRRIRLMYREDFSSSSLIYTVYQIFWCTQIFVGFFDGNKKAPCGAFSNTETFFFCALSYVLHGICLGVNHLSSIHLWY